MPFQDEIFWYYQMDNRNAMRIAEVDLDPW